MRGTALPLSKIPGSAPGLFIDFTCVLINLLTYLLTSQTLLLSVGLLDV